MSYKHLTREERNVIYRMRSFGQSATRIAQYLGRSPSTIGRELRRNSDGLGRYLPGQAQTMANARSRRHIRRPVTDDGPLMRWVENRIRAEWAPEQIAGRLRNEGHDRLPGRSISHATIYNWIWACPQRASRLKTHLRVACKPRRKPYGKPSSRVRIPNRVSIDQRPDVVESRNRIGDWEGDTVVGKGRSGYIATATERKSRYLVARKVDRCTSPAVCGALREGMRRLPRQNVLTMTLDNGAEFTRHEDLARSLGIDVYFADPYSSWQRGTNENTNGLLRQYVPKGRDFKCLTDSQLAAYVRALNNRPRKCLNYRTPAEVFWNRPVALTF